MNVVKSSLFHFIFLFIEFSSFKMSTMFNVKYYIGITIDDR